MIGRPQPSMPSSVFRFTGEIRDRFDDDLLQRVRRIEVGVERPVVFATHAASIAACLPEQFM